MADHHVSNSKYQANRTEHHAVLAEHHAMLAERHTNTAEHDVIFSTTSCQRLMLVFIKTSCKSSRIQFNPAGYNTSSPGQNTVKVSTGGGGGDSFLSL